MSKKILVVDDEKLIVKGVRFSLEQDGMIVDCAYDGNEALEKIRANNYDAILLDLMLPGMSGLEVCLKTREFSDVPIIMVTAKGDDVDKITGLEYGADDYITKPFNILEIKARMKAVLRRSSGVVAEHAPESDVICAKNLRLEPQSKRLFIGDNEIRLTSKEFEVLELLVTHPNKVYSRENLMNIIWGYDFVGDVRTVDVHVRRLREKIEPNSSEPIYVQTKWGMGYYFNDQE